MKKLSFIFLLFSYVAQGQIRVEGEDWTTTGGTSGNTAAVSGPFTDEGVSGQHSAGFWENHTFTTYSLTTTAGLYKFRFRVATFETGVQYLLQNGLGTTLATVDIPSTGSFTVFEDISVVIELPAATDSYKWLCNSANLGADLNYFEYSLLPDPYVNAGADTVIHHVYSGQTGTAFVHATALTLTGKSIASYLWSKVDGPTGGTIASATSATSNITGLPYGTYHYQVKATDNLGGFTYDTLQIIVRKCERNDTVYVVPLADSAQFFYQGKDYASQPHHPASWFSFYPILDVAGGSTVILRNDFTILHAEFYGMEGAPGCPITFTGHDWKHPTDIVLGLKFYDFHHVKVTARPSWYHSTGVNPNGTEPYNMKVHGIVGYEVGRGLVTYAGIGTEFLGNSADGEIDMMHYTNLAYAIHAKDDAQCDTFYNLPTHMTNINIHWVYGRNFYQDVFYLGGTDQLGERETDCIDGPHFYFALRTKNYNVQHNTLSNAGRTFIQLGGHDGSKADVSYNKLNNAGNELVQDQGGGIIVGGMSSNVFVHDNDITCTFLGAIHDFGVSKNHIYNNHTDSTGYLNLTYTDFQVRSRDSIAAALPTFMEASGKYIKNIYLGGIYPMAITPDSTIPYKTDAIALYGNRIGAKSRFFDDVDIAFVNWKGHLEDWTTDNQICNNKRLDNSDAVIGQTTYLGRATPSYSTNCTYVQQSFVKGRKTK